MQSISSFTSTRFSEKNAPIKKLRAPHPLFECAEEIRKAGLYTPKYGQGYWLRVLSRYAKKHNRHPAALYTELLGILKGIAQMDAKYPKGATLTNKLKV